MTRRFALFFILLVTLSSCGPVRDRRSLAGAEALMPERPDSALAVLRGLRPRDLPGLHVRPLHALLLSEALDKNYIDLTDDSLALAANRYYGDHGSKLHRLKSWYYLGRIRFNAGNYAEAVICYNKALEYAEVLTNYHYMGLINREIANAYSQVWDDYHAIEYTNISSKHFFSAGENHYLEYNKLALARMYRKAGKTKESQRILDSLIQTSDDKYLLAETYRTAASLCSSDSSSSPRIALDFYKKVFDYSTTSLSAADYSNIALAYSRLGNSDSTLFYLRKANQYARTRIDTIAVEYDRYRIADNEGDFQLANKLLEYSVFAQDSIIQSVLGQSISFYQGNYYKNESQMNALKARMRALSYGTMILVLSLLAFYLLSRNRKQRAMIIEEMARTAEIQKDFAIMKDEKESLSQAMAVLFENRLRILQTLSDQYDLIEDKRLMKSKQAGRELLKDEILSSFRNKMKDLRNDKDIALSMEETLNVWKDNIMSKFRSVFGADSSSGIRMSEEDFYMAPYYFSGMKQKTISYLTNHTEHSIKERKRRIKQRIESLGSSFSEEKRLFLDNL